MTKGRPTPDRAGDIQGFSFRPHLASLLFHAGLIGVVVAVATLNVRDPVEVIEVEIVEIPPPPVAAAPAVAPRPEPTEPVRPEPLPVPELEQIRKVEASARPYHPAAADINRLQRETSTVPNRRPALPPSFAVPMEATVQGGSGIQVVAVGAGEANVLADPSKPGWPGSAADRALSGVGFPDAEYADTWEITAEPEPINDGDFEPVYPPDARSRRLEAAVEIELLVDSTGTVADTHVLDSGGDQFSLSALEYCRKLRFRPALANQVPVASRIVWVVAYRFGNR
jgi:periplasmic protein TonB